MRRGQNRARSARSRKNGARSATFKNSVARSATIEYYGARSATIKSRALGALKLASEKCLQNHFEKYKTVFGKKSFHYLEPNEDFKLKMKVFSSRDTFEILRFCKFSLCRLGFRKYIYLTKWRMFELKVAIFRQKYVLILSIKQNLSY